MTPTMTPTMTTTMTPTMTTTMTTTMTPTANNITVNTSTTNTLINESDIVKSGFQNMVEGFNSSQKNTEESKNIQSDFTYDDTQFLSVPYGTPLASNGVIWSTNEETVYRPTHKKKIPTTQMNIRKQVYAYDEHALKQQETNIIFAKSQQDLNLERKTQLWNKNQSNDDNIQIHNYNKSI